MSALGTPAPSAVDVVVHQLRDGILSGTLQAGMALPSERDLAAQLVVSRATLREGLSILAQMGLVTTRRGRNGGAVVTTPTAATVASTVTLLFQTGGVTTAQLTEVRRGLEIEAAQLAAARRTDQDLREIGEAFDRYVGSGADQSSHNQEGRRFHYAIARASGNPLLMEMMYSLNQAFAECLELLGMSEDRSSNVAEIHRPIVQAIQRQDVDAARQAMVRHFEQLERTLVQHGLQHRRLGHPVDHVLAPTTDESIHQLRPRMHGRVRSSINGRR